MVSFDSQPVAVGRDAVALRWPVALASGAVVLVEYGQARGLVLSGLVESCDVWSIAARWAGLTRAMRAERVGSLVRRLDAAADARPVEVLAARASRRYGVDGSLPVETRDADCFRHDVAWSTSANPSGEVR